MPNEKKKEEKPHKRPTERVGAIPHSPNALLTESESANYLGAFSPRFLQARRHRGDGPPFVKISSRAIRYRVRDLDDWAAARVCTSTSNTDTAA